MTFGAPRVGDKDFASVLGTVAASAIHRYVNGDDMVPTVPSKGFYKATFSRQFSHPWNEGNLFPGLVALGPDGMGTYVSQVVPHPSYSDLTVVLRYREALDAVNQGKDPGFVSLEGYLAGRLAAAVLDAAGPEPTRRGFIDTLHRIGRFDLGGFELRYLDGSNQGSDAVFLTMIVDSDQILPVE